MRGGIVALIVGASLFTVPEAQAQARSPDIILIVTDDQRFDSLRNMPRTRALLPLRFTHALVANPVCCPSRATILSGLFAEGHHVWSNEETHGGYPAFATWDAENTSLAEALTPGYHTGFAGKYFNAWDGTLPSGWDGFWGLDYDHDARRAPYYGYTIAGTQAPVEPPAYVLDELTDRMRGFIGSAPAEAPLFAYYAPPSPHNAGGLERPIPAEEDRDAAVALAPAPPSTNEARVTDKPRHIASQAPVSASELTRLRVATARTLMSTDRSVAEILEAQAERDPGLANTVVIFTSDNGRLHGEHRWTSKSVPYEEALRVPMLMHHPSMGAGVFRHLVTNADVPATIASVAGVGFDTVGRSLLAGPGPSALVIQGAVSTPRAFCGLRTRRHTYAIYRSGEREYYDLRADPWQLRSRPQRAPRRLVTRAEGGCEALGMPKWRAR